MFMLVSTHKELIRNARQEYNALVDKSNRLTHKWNNLVNQINDLGGQDFLVGKVPHPYAKGEAQFTDSELKSLLQLIHPDKNGGSEVSVRLTQKLNKMRSK